MMRITLVAVCLALAHGADWEKPAFCNENDCPIFEVLEEFEGYELRRYPSAQWVSTLYYANNPVEADGKQEQAFNKLFNYIDGQNANGDKIDMTAPVLTHVMPATGPNCNSEFVMSFYLPYALQEDAPEPTNADLYLQKLGELDVYVSSFTDYASQEDYLRNTIALSQAIDDMDKIDYMSYYTAGYDSPFKWWERHNESWLRAKAGIKPAQPIKN